MTSIFNSLGQIGEFFILSLEFTKITINILPGTIKGFFEFFEPPEASIADICYYHEDEHDEED